MDNIDVSEPAPPFQVRTFGRIRNSPRHFTPGTKQGDMMLILNLSGSGIYKNSMGTEILTDSHICLIPPEDKGILYSSADDPYDHFYCRFQGTYACYLSKKVIEERGSRMFPFPDMKGVSSGLERLPHMIRKKLPDVMGQHELALAKILVSLCSPAKPEEDKELSSHALRQYLIDRLDQLINLDHMAEYFSLSKPSLCRRGKHLLGDTIINISHTIKMDAACELLSIKSMKISEVALRVGFRDPYYFSRTFKKVIGLSPKKWQQRVLESPKQDKFGPETI